jgi:ParB family transcriptional regulator, chromosome partitioning protein
MILQICPSLIVVSPNYPRKKPGQTHIESFAESIRAIGITTPIEVFKSNSEFILCDGLRRLLAALYLGYEKVPVLITEETSDLHKIELQTFVKFASSIHLSPIEEAISLHYLLTQYDYSHSELSVVCGWGEASRLRITRKLSLLSLTNDVQELVHSGELSETHGHMLSKVSDAGKQQSLANRCISEDLSSRQLKQLIDGSLVERAPRVEVPEEMLLAEKKLSGIFSARTSIKPKADGSVDITISCKDLMEFSQLLNRVDGIKQNQESSPTMQTNQ